MIPLDISTVYSYLQNGDLVHAALYGFGLGDMIYPLLAGFLFALARIKIRSFYGTAVLGLLLLGFSAYFVQNLAVKAGLIAMSAAVFAAVLAKIAGGRET